MAGYCNAAVRLQGLTLDRGIGCSIHNSGHSMERLRKTNLYLGQQSERFYNENLNVTFTKVPFSSLYELPKLSDTCPYPLIYNSSTSVTIRYTASTVSASTDRNKTSDLVNSAPGCGDRSVFVENIWPGCGNVHHAPNSRYGYDADYFNLKGSPAPTAVENTCEHYGLRDGRDGKDPRTKFLFNDTKAIIYDLGNFGDCEGGWNLYMRQSMPGLNNKAFAEDSKAPMLNWWPFLFY